MKYFQRSFSSFRWFKKCWCQLQVKVCAQSTGLPLGSAGQGKSVVMLTDCPNMTKAVDRDIKPQTKQTKTENH